MASTHNTSPSGGTKRSPQNATTTSGGTAKRTKTLSNSSAANVRVVARLRPLSTKEVNESSTEAIAAVRGGTIRVDLASRNNTPKTFEYDGAFGPNTTQQALYEHTIGDMVRTNTFKGFNTTSEYSTLENGFCFFVGLTCFVNDALDGAGTVPFFGAVLESLHSCARHHFVIVPIIFLPSILGSSPPIYCCQPINPIITY